MLEISRLCKAEEFLLQKAVVLFDLDDTLYPEKAYVKSGYAAIERHYGKIDNMAEKLWSAFVKGEQAINHVLSNEGLFTAEELKLCLDIYRFHQPNIFLYPDALDLLNKLKARGVRLGLITDGRPEGQWAKIKALKIEPFFDKILITDELGGITYRKPNTVSFEKMQSHFNIPYSSMVYVGDNPAKDFIAPELLGMDSVYFKNPDSLYFKHL